MPVVNVLGAQLSGGLQRSNGVFDFVVLLKAGFKAFENLHRLLDRRLYYVNLLEASGQGGVFFENPAVFGKCGCANALELTRA